MTIEQLNLITRTGRPVLFENKYWEKGNKDRYFLATGVVEGSIVTGVLTDGTVGHRMFFENLTPCPVNITVVGMARVEEEDANNSDGPDDKNDQVFPQDEEETLPKKKKSKK